MRDLTKVENQKCASCHANLTAVCKAEPSVRADVQGFTERSHGDFQSLKVEDPGRVFFDHAQHMRAGQVEQGQRGGMTLANLPAEFRDRYRQSDEGLVQLSCGDCHPFSGNPEPAVKMLSDRELGRYIEPIAFDQHCAACHAISPGISTADTLSLPHAVSWNKIDLLLEATVAGARASGQARMPGDDSQANPLPGVGEGQAAPDAAIAPGTVEAARSLVVAQCKKCHTEQDYSQAAITAARRGTAEPMIPARWLKKGLYDHAAHDSMVGCKYCHAKAYEDDDSIAAADHNVVMIGGIETCAGCHRDVDASPPDGFEEMFAGVPSWGSDRCTLCHRYHGEAVPSSGPVE